MFRDVFPFFLGFSLGATFLIKGYLLSFITVFGLKEMFSVPNAPFLAL